MLIKNDTANLKESITSTSPINVLYANLKTGRVNAFVTMTAR